MKKKVLSLLITATFFAQAMKNGESTVDVYYSTDRNSIIAYSNFNYLNGSSCCDTVIKCLSDNCYKAYGVFRYSSGGEAVKSVSQEAVDCLKEKIAAFEATGMKK